MPNEEQDDNTTTAIGNDTESTDATTATSETGSDTPVSMYDDKKVVSIAVMCHQANKTWCELNDDNSQKDWNEAEEWQRESAIKGVRFRLDNPDAGVDAQHNAWMADKTADGWVYGEVKDAEQKTHPCIVAFDQLPEFQKKKDAIFCALVDSLK